MKRRVLGVLLTLIVITMFAGRMGTLTTGTLLDRQEVFAQMDADISSISDGLYSYFPMENKDDILGYATTGDLGAISYVTGLKGNALSVETDANNSMIYFGDSIGDRDNTYRNVLSNDATISAWFNVREFNSLTDKQLSIIDGIPAERSDQGGCSLGNHWQLALANVAGCSYGPCPGTSGSEKIRLNIYQSESVVMALDALEGNLTTDTWYMATITHDSVSHTWKLYVNGNLENSITNSTGISAEILNADCPYAIGNRPTANAYGKPFAGRIDEVGFWNRVLSEDEIGFLYNNGAGRSFEELTAGGPDEPTCSTTPIPGGGTITFSSDRDGIKQYYVMDGSECNLLQLTFDSEPVGYMADWNPDGTKVAYKSGRYLYTMNADGSERTKLSPLEVSEEYPAWSPDGNEVAFHANVGRIEMFVVNADGTNLRQLTYLPEDTGGPSWTPDGTKIVFSSRSSSGRYAKIWIMDADGSNQRKLMADNGAHDNFPAVSPDGSKIAFVSTRDGNEEIYLMNIDGSNQTRLTNNGASNWLPRWSPDGSRILFHSNLTGNNELYVMNADGSDPTQITSNPADDSWAVWGGPSINTAPVTNTGGPYNGDEGGQILLDGATASDPDDDQLSYNWNVDSPLCSFSDASILNPSITCQDNGSFTTTLTVSDGVADPVSSSTSVEVFNVAPTIDSVVAPSAPVNILDQPVDVTVGYSDPGTADTHDVSWAWGDLSSDTQTTASSPASQSHTYSEAGAYAVEVTVTDDDGGSDTATYEYIVIYDPEGGFVTGGGWIDSEIGWCQFDAVCAGAEGKANFGFVSKYKKGAQVPTGNTQFNFKAGDFNFHSSEYDWLVVNQGGTNAQYKGIGTINGEGNYKFMLWASDGETDTFRIRIWYEDWGEIVVYDNGFDQPIGGGNIVVHTGK